jgi:hypothetical protein
VCLGYSGSGESSRALRFKQYNEVKRAMSVGQASRRILAVDPPTETLCAHTVRRTGSQFRSLGAGPSGGGNEAKHETSAWSRAEAVVRRRGVACLCSEGLSP